MGKYQPLADFLKNQAGDLWDASFVDIERLLRSSLPPSARRHRSWWGNTSRGNHSQARGWMAAGWWTDTPRIDLRNERIRFVRKTERRDETLDLDRLRKRAMEVSGIDDPHRLERAALTALIEREAARQLAAMGGTMPGFTVPPRERPER